MTTRRYPWVPRVEVIAPNPDRVGMTPNVLTSVLVDGRLWAVESYSVNGKGVDDVQTVTLTFLADVTVSHMAATMANDDAT